MNRFGHGNLRSGFEVLFHLQFRNQLFVLAAPFVGQHAPGVAEHASETRRQMPEPAEIAVADKAAQRKSFGMAVTAGAKGAAPAVKIDKGEDGLRKALVAKLQPIVASLQALQVDAAVVEVDGAGDGIVFAGALPYANFQQVLNAFN